MDSSQAYWSTAHSEQSDVPPPRTVVKSEIPTRGVANDELEKLQEELVQAEQDDKVTGFLCFLIAAAALAGFLYGYDTGVVGVALPLVGDDLGHNLSYSEQEIATSATTIGAIFGSAIIGYYSDGIGRKWSMFISDLFFTVGAILIASSYSLAQMSVGRLVMGFGVGGAAVIAPLYITELAPTYARGRCVGVIGFFIPFGQVVSAALGAACQNVKHGWRLLFALGVVPSMLQLCLMHWLPESPRVLLLRGQVEEARLVLQQINKHQDARIIELKLRVAQYTAETSTVLQRNMKPLQRFKMLFKTPKYRRSIISLLYYAGQLFGLLGLSNPALGALIPSSVNAFFLFLGFNIIDKLGRRGLMMWFVPVMLAGLVWNIIAFHYLCEPTGGRLDVNYDYDRQMVGVVIGGIVVFVTGFGATYAHVIWQQSEFLALEIRATGSAIATTANWIGNLVVSVAYLTQLESLGPSGTYCLYLGFSTVGYIFVVFCYPETKGLSIDETHSLFEGGFGVRRSREIRREKAELMRAFRDANAEETKAAMKTLEAKHTGRYNEGHHLEKRSFLDPVVRPGAAPAQVE